MLKFPLRVNMREEVMGQWRNFRSRTLHSLYSSPDIIRQVKSRRMSWAGHVARVGGGRNVYRVLVGKPGVDGRMRSKWTLGRLVGGLWSGFTWLRIGTVGGLL
jgi:hypothetical protein